MKNIFNRTYLVFFVLLILCVVAARSTAGTKTYTYDNAGRPVKSDYGNNKTITYTYDKMRNLIKTKVISFTQQTAWVDFN